MVGVGLYRISLFLLTWWLVPGRGFGLEVAGGLGLSSQNSGRIVPSAFAQVTWWHMGLAYHHMEVNTAVYRIHSVAEIAYLRFNPGRIGRLPAAAGIGWGRFRAQRTLDSRRLDGLRQEELDTFSGPAAVVTVSPYPGFILTMQSVFGRGPFSHQLVYRPVAYLGAGVEF